MKGIIAGLAVATAGFAVLMARLLPEVGFGSLPPRCHRASPRHSYVAWRILFGIGMVLAGGCTSGSLYRAGEGYVGRWWPWSVLCWAWRFPHIRGIGGGRRTSVVRRSSGSRANSDTWGATTDVWRPATVSFWWFPGGNFGRRSCSRSSLMRCTRASSFGEHLRALGHTVFVKGWPVIVGGVALATLNVFLYTYRHPWGVVAGLGIWADKLAGAT